MIMLDNLREELDEICLSDDASCRFLQGLLIQDDEGRDWKERPLSKKQFQWLVDLNERYSK